MALLGLEWLGIPRFHRQAATVIGWHRKGFGLFWSWKIRHGNAGSPAVPQEVRQLIRMLSRENPLWGAPYIHGELLKLGINIGETSVSKYMLRHRKPPSQTWRTFLDNHLKTMASVDFFVVPTIRFQILSMANCQISLAPGTCPSFRHRSEAFWLLLSNARCA